MNRTHQNEWDLRGWYVAETTFVSTHVAALIFYVLGAVVSFQRLSVELNQPSGIGEASDQVMGLFLFSVCFLLAPWRRWVHSGRNKKSYVFWTCLEGGFTLLFGAAVAHQLTSGSSVDVVLLSGASFFLWLAHTVMIPKHEIYGRRTSNLEYLKRWN
ncbi:MAG: hypothetical protein QNI91_12565 [Arenicellales bacterium]|nr:hypothetical protein [Arenicellales bacterium]